MDRSEADKRLFVARTSHRPIEIRYRDDSAVRWQSDDSSRLGGRRPAWFSDSGPACAICGGPMRFWFTVGTELLAPLKVANWRWPDCVADRVDETPTTWSVFLCADFRCLLKGRRQWTPSPIAVVAHPDDDAASGTRAGAANVKSGDATAAALHSRADGGPEVIFQKVALLRLGEEGEDQTAQGETPTFSKLGGRPGWIQDEPRGLLDGLQAAGYEFLLQFNEESYPAGYIDGDYPLGCGSIYLFARFAHGKSSDAAGVSLAAGLGISAGSSLAAADMAAIWQG
ncbi:MAG TPA: hypothetical protein PLV92_11105 [Pirellulaceae bacterium]|nr:hypothetical protein [Pirellulaceae bacterium]